jgi:hypothetical protein
MRSAKVAVVGLVASGALAGLCGCGGGAGASGGSAAVPQGPRGEPVRIVVRLEPGAVYQGQLAVVQVLPTGHTVETDVSVRTRVLGAEDGTFQLEDRFGDLRVRMNDEPFEPAPEMDGMDQVRIRYAMDSRGRTVGDVSPLGVTEGNADFAEQLVAAAGSDAVPFPAAPVRPGEGWSSRRELAMETAAGVLEGSIQERHELARVETVDGEDWAVLLITGRVAFEPLRTDEMSLNGEGSVSGERRILLADGFTSRAHSELTVTFHGKGGTPRREFRMEQRTSTHLRTERVADGDRPAPTVVEPDSAPPHPGESP